MPAWKKYFFAALAFVVFFTGLELFLAAIGTMPFLATEDPFFGFSKSVPLFIERKQPDGPVMLETAGNKLNNFNYQQFPKEKHANTYRIFCMGGSTTYGNPYEDPTSFCGWLREFLKAADPSRNWEVINAGGISYASYRVANLMNELSVYKPDMFIVYQGENEFLEERTYRDVMAAPALIKEVKAVLARTRAYTIINNAVRLVKKGKAASIQKRFEMTGEVKEILNDTIGPTSYRRDDVLKRQVIEHYKLSLKRMIAIARSVDSKIIFVTPASNLKDMSPFKSENNDGLSEAEKKRFLLLYRNGRKLQESGDQARALALFDEALGIDARYADLHFRRGRTLFKLGRFKEAETAFVKAKDEDICPLRILTQTSEALASTTAENNVPLLDFAGLVGDKCYRERGHRIPGNEYFMDHLHPTIEMNRALSLSLLDMLVKYGIARPSAGWNEKAVAEKVEAALDRKKHAAALKSLAKLFDWAGKYGEASYFFSKAAADLGDEEDFLYAYARYCDRNDRTEEALKYHRKTLVVNPNNARAHRSMAEIFQLKGDDKNALLHYREVIRIISSSKQEARKGLENYLINANENIARLLSSRAQGSEALAYYTELLRLDPGHDKAHTDMGVVLAKEGRIKEAASHFRDALKINPRSSRAHYNLGKIFAETGKNDEAIVHYSEALKIDPGFAEAHNNFGVILAQLGRINEASPHFSEAVRLEPDYVEALFNLGSALSLQGRVKEAESYFLQAKKLGKK